MSRGDQKLLTVPIGPGSDISDLQHLKNLILQEPKHKPFDRYVLYLVEALLEDGRVDTERKWEELLPLEGSGADKNAYDDAVHYVYRVLPPRPHVALAV